MFSKEKPGEPCYLWGKKHLWDKPRDEKFENEDDGKSAKLANEDLESFNGC